MGMGDSPGSIDGDDDGAVDGHHEKKRQPGVKRACNECRQQKVSVYLLFIAPTFRPRIIVTSHISASCSLCSHPPPPLSLL